MSYEIDLFNDAFNPLDDTRWVHVAGSGYNTWASQNPTPFVPPGGYAYITNSGTEGQPAVAFDTWGWLETCLVRADFYDSMPDECGIAFRASLVGSPSAPTDWEGWRLVHVADTLTQSSLKLYKRVSGSDMLEHTESYSHPSGEPYTHLAVILRPNGISAYAADRTGRFTLMFDFLDSFNSAEGYHGLYGVSSDNQKCDTFEVAELNEIPYWLDSFDHHKSTRLGASELEQKYYSDFPRSGDPWGNETIVAGFLPGSDGAVRMDATVTDVGAAFDQARLLMDIANDSQKVCYGSYYYFGSYPTGDESTLIVTYSANANPICVTIDSSGQLRIVEGANYGPNPASGRIVRDGPTSPIPLGQPVCIQLRAYWDRITTMYYELWVDGISALSGQYDTDWDRFSYHTGLFGFREIALGSIACFDMESVVLYDCDDWYFCQGAYPWNELVPNHRVRCLRPIGPGSNTNWAPVGAPSNWEAVDDTFVNFNTDYIEHNVGSETDSYEMQDLEGTPNIHAIQSNVAAAQVTLGRDMVYWAKLGANDTFGNFFGHWVTDGSQTIYPIHSRSTALNHWTFNQWSASDINGLEVGFYLSTGVTTFARVTQLTLEVLTGIPAVSVSFVGFGTIIGQ